MGQGMESHPEGSAGWDVLEGRTAVYADYGESIHVLQFTELYTHTHKRLIRGTLI